jgi:hypothetical protein
MMLLLQIAAVFAGICSLVAGGSAFSKTTPVSTQNERVTNRVKGAFWTGIGVIGIPVTATGLALQIHDVHFTFFTWMIPGLYVILICVLSVLMVTDYGRRCKKEGAAEAAAKTDWRPTGISDV